MPARRVIRADVREGGSWRRVDEIELADLEDHLIEANEIIKTVIAERNENPVLH